MECRVCGSAHVANLQSGSERADGITRYHRGSYQCFNEQCLSNEKEWDAERGIYVKPNWRRLLTTRS